MSGPIPPPDLMAALRDSIDRARIRQDDKPDGGHTWEVLITSNEAAGERWRRYLCAQGHFIERRNVYTVGRPAKWEGNRFTKVYLTPDLAAGCDSIRGLLERAQAINHLKRSVLPLTCFEGFVVIGEGGFISAPSKAL
jgi:hypothetical protein